MSRLAVRALLAAACAIALARPAQPAPLESSRAMRAALTSKGRAEAVLRYTLAGMPGEAGREVRARLALEPPDRARLDVRGTGEIVTVRADGGDWLDPAAGQLIRMSPARVAPALRWWRVLLGSGTGVRERRDSPGRWWVILPARAGEAADSALVQLDARGLPVRLELPEAEGGTVYRLSEWRFLAARGESGFTLRAPPGVVEVRLP